MTRLKKKILTLTGCICYRNFVISIVEADIPQEDIFLLVSFKAMPMALIKKDLKAKIK